MAIDSDKVTAFINALKGKFQLSKYKKTSWSSTVSDENYPSEKLVKDSLDAKIDTSNIVTTQFSASTSDEKVPSEKLVASALAGKLDASSAFSGDYTDLTNVPNTFTPSSHTHGNITNDGKIGSTANKPLITTTNGAITTGSFGTEANTFAQGNHTHSQYLTDHQTLSDIGGIIDVEKQTTAEEGYAATYVIKQGSSSSKSQAGVKINIPKDFLVKSGEVKTAASGDLATLGSGYSVGDKYIDFVVNTKNNDGTDEHIYINVKDLVEDTTYSADETTLTLSSGGEFSVKSGSIGTTQLASGVVTSLGYADTFHSSAAASITSTDINNWNSNTSLTTADIDTEIEAVLTQVTNAISNIS